MLKAAAGAAATTEGAAEAMPQEVPREVAPREGNQKLVRDQNGVQKVGY